MHGCYSVNIRGSEVLVWALECMVWLQRHHKGVENVRGCYSVNIRG